VSINGKTYRCTGVLIRVMNHRNGQQLFKDERIGLEVEADERGTDLTLSRVSARPF
jgi:hypothetical protein